MKEKFMKKGILVFVTLITLSNFLGTIEPQQSQAIPIISSFSTNISVWEDDDHYFYSFNLTFFPEKDEIEYTDSDHLDPVKRDLPYNKILERI